MKETFLKMTLKKGFKITDVNRMKKVGVAAGNLKELMEKSCRKLEVNVNSEGCKVFVADDGTLVDDDEYLLTLPSQTLLVLVKPKEEMKTEFTFLYDLIRSTKLEYIDAGRMAADFLTTNIKEKFRVFQKYVANASDENTILSLRTDHPDWFKGLEPCEKRKETFMAKRSKDRMRGYYFKVKTSLLKSNPYIHSKNGNGKYIIDQFLFVIRQMLQENDYNSSYFDRSSDEDKRLCSQSGNFDCQGLWNQKRCMYDDHAINPYRSREERLLFQTWNLDHKIELSRAILPNILQSVEGICKNAAICCECNRKTEPCVIDSGKYYLQIFTRDNLKLVHIVCHYKGKHLNESEIFIVCEKCLSKISRKN